MRIIVDLGSPIYAAASIFANIEDLDKAKDIIDRKLNSLFNDLQATHYIMFVDGDNNFRKRVKHDYKANRKNTIIPETLKPLQQYMVDEWGAHRVNTLEADDAVAITNAYYRDLYKKDADRLKEVNIVSADKDLLQVVGQVIKLDRKEGYIRYTINENASYRSIYNQMIQGDTADNVKGLPGFGPAKFVKVAEGEFSEMLHSIKTDKSQNLEMLRLLELYMLKYGVLKGVEEFSQNFLCLYLKTEPIYNFTIPKWKKIEFVGLS